MRPIVLAALLALSPGLAALAQCPGNATATGPAIPGVNPSQVTAMVEWDPDGPGPLGSKLVVSGGFEAAGSVEAAGMVTWDGAQWEAFPVPLANVNALAVFNGDLVAAPSNASPAAMTRWNAAAGMWEPMGALLAPPLTLAVFNNQLYAGGAGIVSGTSAPRPMARWNGTAWQGVTSVLTGTVHALHVHNNLLFIGGGTSFGGLIVASYTGSSTTLHSPQSAGTGGPARCFASHNGLLYMGITSFQPLMTYDGAAWQTAGFGVFTYNPATPAVYAMRSFGGDLYVVGDFVTNFQFHEAGNIIRLRQGEWQHPSQTVGVGSWPAPLGDLTEFEGRLIIGGSAGGQLLSAAGVCAYDGTAYSALTTDLDGAVYTAVRYNGQDVLAGAFGRAGAVALNGAGVRSAGTWTPLAEGPGINCNSAIVHNGDLIVSGYTALRDGMPVRRWDGTSWSPMGSGNHQYVGLSGIASFNGDLVVAGGTGNISRWDGAAWQPLGLAFGSVYTMTVVGNRLIAGGHIPDSGHVRAWDGAAWHNLGSGVNNEISKSCAYRGEVIVAGRLTASGTTPLNHIARFDGALWQPLGAGFSGGVSDIAAFDHRLFLIGNLPEPPYQNVLWAWDGQAWNDLTPTLPPTLTATWRPYRMKVVEDRLLIFDPSRNGVIEYTQTCGPICGTSDYDGDSDFGTDADIEAFFACLAGSCCPTCFFLGSDFNDDGDAGTDQDIEAFFRVLSGGNC